jgi:hypothetical protein
MTHENDKLRTDVRALLIFTQTTLPDYATDPVVQRRVGKALANIPADVRIHSVGDTWC